MTRWLSVFFLYFIFPAIGFSADFSTYTSGLTFTPSAGDYSVIFLENLFGVVDGVLHGTGSQMMGQLLGVLNAAALTLGGVMIMYIILVSTLNTAHEGEMLGQRWSSIWIPMRAVSALALLLPKASGYCMMQVFVMWTIVQGVGVADKVWSVALDYLNRGGVIIKANLSATTSSSADEHHIISGGATMLYGQVCMYGLERQLENAHESYMSQKNNETGPCSGTPDATMQAFCDGTVPDFISTVDPVSFQQSHDDAFQQSHDDALSWTLPMPNFESSSMYSKLNGMCGSIHWNAVDTAALSDITTLSTTDTDLIKLTRTLAVAQMYTGLVTTAKKIVDNDPQINLSLESNPSEDASKVAADQFGVPLLSSSSVCTGSDATCLYWGADPMINKTPSLLQGSELQDAVADYNGIMSSTVKLLSDAENAEKASEARAFIENAKHTGWILAGSYFFDLIRLNGSAAASEQTDTNTGLDASNFQMEFMKAFDAGHCSGTYGDLCRYLNQDETKAAAVRQLIEGAETVVPKPDFSSATLSFDIYANSTASSTVYGYVSNSMNLDLSSQPSETPVFQISPIHATAPDSEIHFDFGGDNDKCLGQKLFGACIIKEKKLIGVAEKVMSGFVNFLVDTFYKAASGFFKYVLYLPMQGFATIFSKAMDLLNQEGINPIAALGLMGISFVDFSMTTWVGVGLAVAFLSFLTSGPIIALLMMFLPMFLGWIGAMLGIAFITAYYIPFLPYMLFTFGAIGWLVSVIEMMVASPLLALGIMHPEGHDALGKGEQGLMMLCNVFLRPALMVIGFIVGIALSYVGVWVMQAGFQRVLSYLQGPDVWGASFTGWGQIYGYFFSCLMYVSLYLTIVQKAFTLIAVLPDRALTVLGVQASQIGQESAQWTEEAKGQMKEGTDAMKSAGSQTAKSTAGASGEMVGLARSGIRKLFDNKPKDPMEFK